MESGDDPVVYCWGCFTLILVPSGQDGKPAQMFKCGWCQAVNDLEQQPLLCAGPQQQPPVPDYYTQQQHRWQQQQHWQPSVWQPGAPAAAPQEQQQPQRSRRGKWRRCLGAAQAAWRCVVVCLVLVLVGSIAGCGILTLLPLLCTTWLTYLPNLGIALLLLCEVLFNYAAAVLTPAGRVSELVQPPVKTPGGFMPQGCLQHWSWCKHCQAAKPPHAHHCQSCRTCVVQMDHHCVFIGNCVGAGNLRCFLLILLWALLAAAYILCMCSLLVWQHWGEVQQYVKAGRSRTVSADALPSSMQPQEVWVVNPGSRAVGSSVSNSSANSSWGGSRAAHVAVGGPDVWLLASTGIFMLVLQASPWWLLAAYYLVAASLGLLIAVGALFGSQLYYLGLGVGYIDHLKAMAAAAEQQPDQQEQQRLGSWERWVSRLRLLWVRWWEVMGLAQPPAWRDMLLAIVAPRWGVPAAAAAKKCS